MEGLWFSHPLPFQFHLQAQVTLFAGGGSHICISQGVEDAEESQCTTASVPNSNLKAKYDGKIVFLQLVNAVPIFSLYS